MNYDFRKDYQNKLNKKDYINIYKFSLFFFFLYYKKLTILFERVMRTNLTVMLDDIIYS